jgi:Na+/H+-translocating membrane pyrophosphatase
MLDLTTPSLLFSAISLILLAYTNRLLSYASVVRALKEKHQQTHDPKDIAQIANLRKRLYLTRSMQILGILSLLLCVIAMFFIYVSWQIFAAWIFGIALLLLAASLCVCIWEINISVKALEIHLEDISSKEKLKQ